MTQISDCAINVLIIERSLFCVTEAFIKLDDKTDGNKPYFALNKILKKEVSTSINRSSCTIGP